MGGCRPPMINPHPAAAGTGLCSQNQIHMQLLAVPELDFHGESVW
jgi:hypothetical protein